MRVVLLGAAGMLGRDLAEAAPREATVYAYTRHELDITDSRAVAQAVSDLRPDVLINAAGYTAVDRAETEPHVAFRVNGEAVGELGRIAVASGSRVVHFSTDYVFDGRATMPYKEEAPTNPINVYGASKLAGEIGLRQSGARYLIVRTQWLFGQHGRSFPRTMWERALRRQPTRVVADQVGRPTYAPDLANATWSIVQQGAEGLYHVAGGGTASWFDVALRIFRDLGCAELLKPCATAEYPVPAARPRHTPLSTARAEAILGHPLPQWEDGLARFSSLVLALPS